jgi:hypothetical protein
LLANLATVADQENLTPTADPKDSYTAKDLPSLRALMQSANAQECISALLIRVACNIVCGKLSITQWMNLLLASVKKLKLISEPDGSVEVHDDGRGIPVDKGA